MVCEICGKHLETKKAIVEGVMLNVCENCSKFGNVVEVEKPAEEVKEKKIIREEISDDVEVVIDGYPDIIKKEREKRNMTQKELAKALAEKESTIHGVESGRIPLSFQLAKKFQQFFGIKLIGSVKRPHKKVNLNFKSKDVTIGDLLGLKKDL